MRQTSFRATFSSQFIGRLTSVASIFRRCSSIACPPQIQGLELDRAATLIDGCDYNHWLVVMNPPIGYPPRHQIVERYIQTLASALGSDEEAKRSIYSVSTKYYYAFGCKINENVIHRIKLMPDVRWVLPDSYLCLGNNDYGGEPFTDGCSVPYNEMFHKDWLQDPIDNGFKRRIQRRRSRKKEQKTGDD